MFSPYMGVCCWSWNEHFDHLTIWASDQQRIWASGDSKMKNIFVSRPPYPASPWISFALLEGSEDLHKCMLQDVYCTVHCSGLQWSRVKVAIWRTAGGHVVINMSACAKTICTLHHLFLIYLAAMHLMLGAPIKMKSQTLKSEASPQSKVTQHTLWWFELKMRNGILIY